MNKKYNLKIAYIYSETPNYIRVSKCLPFFAETFTDVHYIGCSRTNKWDRNNMIPGVSYHIEDRSLKHGFKSVIGAIGFLSYVKKKINEIKPDLVIATNEEYVLPFITGYIDKPKYLVCDLTDSMAIRMMGPARHLNIFWSLLSYYTKKNIDGLVEVTEERLERYKFKPKNTAVIYNSPNWKQVENEPDDPRPYIYVCGSALDELSGIETLLKAVEKIDSLRIVFAGRPVGAWMNNTFIKHPKVDFMGEVSPDESLKIGKSACAIFAHYKPVIVNYIYAAPNKLYDAMMLGTPILLNSECKISQFVNSYNLGHCTPFGDIDLLEKALIKVGAKNNNDPSKETNSDIFRKRYSWEQMEKRWLLFFDNLMRSKIG